MNDKRNTNFIFLEQMPNEVKRAYLSEIKAFLYSDSENYLNKEHDGTLSPLQIAQLLLFASRIHYKVENYQEFIELIKNDNTEDYYDTPEFKKYITSDPEIENIYIWSLAKDLIAINYRLCTDILDAEKLSKIEDKKYKEIELIDSLDEKDPKYIEKFENLHFKNFFRWYKQSPYILKFFNDTFIDDNLSAPTLSVWANSVENYVEFTCSDLTMYEADDADFKSQLESFEEEICDDVGEGIGLMPLNALYFTGSPDGLRATDYIGILVKAFGIATKANSIGKAGLALFSLSNPVTGFIGLATLGITGVSFLAKNKEMEKRRLKLSLAKTHNIIYSNANDLIKTFLDEIYKVIYDNDRDDLKKIELKPYLRLLWKLNYASDYLGSQAEECKRAELEISLPVYLDRRRLKAITSSEKYEPIRKYVETCYYSENYKEKNLRNRLRYECSINDLMKLQSIFSDLGYFSVTGIAKKALFFGR